MNADLQRIAHQLAQGEYHTVEHWRDAVRRAAPRGTRQDVLAESRRIAGVRAARAKLRDHPVPMVREWLRNLAAARIRPLVEAICPRPTGAGETWYYWHESPAVGLEHEIDQRWPRSGEVAGSYKYMVRDHWFSLSAPRDISYASVAGVATIYRRREWLATGGARTAPIAAWVIERGRGYNVRTAQLWLYHSRHFPAKLTAATVVARYRAERRAQAESRLAGMRRRLALIDGGSRVWVDRAALHAVGACDAGIDAAQAEVQRLLGAGGEVGAVRMDWLLRQGGHLASWAQRAAGYAHVSA